MNNKEIREENNSLEKYLEMSPFNSDGGDSIFRACVGRNGGYDQATIYDGFVDAVRTLIDSISTYKNFADPMVYPILFCVRHSIELFLKKLYATLQYLQCMKNNPSDFNKLLKLEKIYSRLTYLLEECDDNIKFSTYNGVENPEIQKYHLRKTILNKRIPKLESTINTLNESLFGKLDTDEYTHDLSELMSKVLNVYQIDERIELLFSKVLPLLNYYKDIDPKGDAFRYWFDKEGNAHFQTKDIGIVRLDIIDKQFNQIISYFEEIEFEMFYLIKEYKTGTFTKKLSRSQIEEISKLLPKPDEFGDKIKNIKNEIKLKYQIGSKEFDSILDLIRNHREFSANMGKEKPFRHLSDNTLKILAKCSLNLDNWENSSNAITLNELNLLFTFSEICGWRYGEKNYAYFSEDLHWLFCNTKHTRSISKYDIVPTFETKHIINGMEKCGQITYALKLKQYIKEFELQSKMP